MLYKAINGESSNAREPSLAAERRDEPNQSGSSSTSGTPPRYDGPPTPCPAKVFIKKII